jgi:hypothetical protein
METKIQIEKGLYQLHKLGGHGEFLREMKVGKTTNILLVKDLPYVSKIAV